MKTFYFTIILSVAIPLFAAVEFLGFEASQTGENVFLEWSTASETQNLGFLLERRTDPDSSWNPLDDFLHNDALLGQGTVTTTTYYTYTDSSVEDGTEYFYRIAGVDEANNIGYLDSVSILVAVTAYSPGSPGHFYLDIYPNPFNAHTLIRFSVPEDAITTSLRIFDIRGTCTAVLHERRNMQNPEYTVRWNAGNAPAGIYFCTLHGRRNTGEFFQRTKKMLLVK